MVHYLVMICPESLFNYTSRNNGGKESQILDIEEYLCLKIVTKPL